MRIEYLEEFAALARFLSFTETASKLNMSQPTLSKHINSLERELKVPLFSRDGASLSLTKAGKLVLPHAFAIIESRKQMTIAAKQGMSMLTPHLTIGGNVGLKTVLERINLFFYVAMLIIATLGPMGPMNSFFGASTRLMLAMGRCEQDDYYLE